MIFFEYRYTILTEIHLRAKVKFTSFQSHGHVSITIILDIQYCSGLLHSLPTMLQQAKGNTCLNHMNFRQNETQWDDYFILFISCMHHLTGE